MKSGYRQLVLPHLTSFQRSGFIMDFDYDCDHFSIKVRTEDIPLFQAMYMLSGKFRPHLRETRGENLFALTMGPVVMLIDGGKQRVIQSMRENGVMVCSNDDPKIVAKIPGRVIDAEKLVKVLKDASIDSVFLYAFGFKSTSPDLMDKLDWACQQQGDPDNCFDIGVMIPADTVFLVRATQAYSSLEQYKVFAHLGRGYGSIEFTDRQHRAKVKVYPRWVHCLKSTSLDPPLIPTKRRECRSFKEKHLRILEDLESFSSKQLGGIRIECKVKASTCSDAIAQVKDLGIINMMQRLDFHDIPPRDILNACREGLTVLDSLGLFQGTDANDTNPFEKQACVDYTNLVGYCLPPVFIYQVRKVMTDGDIFARWRTTLTSLPRLVPLAPEGAIWSDWNEMGKWLKYRQVPTGRGYTLSLARSRNQIWEQRWWVEEVTEPADDFPHFLAAMAHTVEENNVRNWREMFVLNEIPAEFEFDLNQLRRAAISARADERPAVLRAMDAPEQINELRIERTPEQQLHTDMVSSSEPLPPAPWFVTVPIREPLQRMLARVATRHMTHRGRNEFTGSECTAMLEFVFQYSQSNGTPSPGNVSFWNSAVDGQQKLMNQRTAATLRNKWRTTVAGLYNTYRERRLREVAEDSI